MNKYKTILAIDTSCDETSVAITHGTTSVVSLVVSQTDLHKPYGGVFPTVAKEAHKQEIAKLTKRSLNQAKLSWDDIEAVAVTAGPGLAPALEVGINHAKKIAQEHNKPLIAVNHIEGHLLSCLVERQAQDLELDTQLKQAETKLEKTPWPILGIIISGKHCDFILMEGIGKYKRLGWTIDDAAGEALDKVGRMLDLGYPAGPTIEEFAKQGNENKFDFPLPMTTSGDYNLSFSGLKTFSRNLIADLEKEKNLNQQDVTDLAASFQKAVFRHITYKLEKILKDHPEIKEIWLGGGVIANNKLKAEVRKTVQTANNSITVKIPYNKKLCGDNAAMIGVTAYLAQQKDGFDLANPEQLDRKPRWKVE